MAILISKVQTSIPDVLGTYIDIKVRISVCIAEVAHIGPEGSVVVGARAVGDARFRTHGLGNLPKMIQLESNRKRKVDDKSLSMELNQLHSKMPSSESHVCTKSVLYTWAQRIIILGDSLEGASRPRIHLHCTCGMRAEHCTSLL